MFFLRASRARKKNILLRVLSKLRRQPFVVRHSVRIILVRGLKKRARVSRSLSPHGSSNLFQFNPLFILRCGPKDHELLVPQRLNRIDGSGAACWHVARRQPRSQKNGGGQYEREWVR